MPGSMSRGETADLTLNITNRYKPFKRPYWFGLTASIFGIGAGLPFLIALADLSSAMFTFFSVLLSLWAVAGATFFWIGPDIYNKRFAAQLRAEDNLTSKKARDMREVVYSNVMFAAFGLSLLTTAFSIALLTVYVPGVFYNGMGAVPGEIWFAAAVVALGSCYQMRNCVKNGWGFSEKILTAIDERCLESAGESGVEMRQIPQPPKSERGLRAGTLPGPGPAHLPSQTPASADPTSSVSSSSPLIP